MLKFMRANKKLKWILWPIVASFVFGIFAYFGGAFSGRGRRATALTWAAKVGSHEIGIREFQNAYQAQERMYRQVFGQNFNPEMMRNFDVGRNVLVGLVQNRIALLEAGRLGFQASPQEVLARVRTEPLFQKDGQFVGVEAYQKILRDQGMDIAAFERGIQEDIVLAKYQGFVRNSIHVTEEEVRSDFEGANDKASLTYVLLSPASYADKVTIDPARERAFYEAHKDRYKSEETRHTRYLLVRMDERARLLALKEESRLRSYYEENKDKLYKVPVGSRRARHILFQLKPDSTPAEDAAIRARAEEIAQRAKSGEPFADLALRYSEDLTSSRRGGDLGYFKRGDMVPQFEEAVFSMAPGDIRGPVRTDFGYHVIQLSETEDTVEKVRPFEDVRDEIALTLFGEKARAQVAETVDAIQKDLDAGKTLDEAAQARSLQVEDAGWVTLRQGLPALGGYQTLVDALFGLETGKTSKALDAFGGDKVFLSPVEIKPPAPLPFEQVQARLAEDMRADAQMELARADAERVRAAVLSGKPFETAIQGLPGSPGVQTLPAVTRAAGAPEFADVEGLVDEILGLDAGALGPVHQTAGGALLYRVDTRTRPDPAAYESSRASIRERLVNQRFQERYSSILQALADGPYKSKVSYNAELMRLVAGPATPS